MAVNAALCNREITLRFLHATCDHADEKVEDNHRPYDGVVVSEHKDPDHGENIHPNLEAGGET